MRAARSARLSSFNTPSTMTNPFLVPVRLFPLLLFACTAPQPDGNSLDVSAFASRLAKNDAQLVDVRTAAEYASGHILGALNLDQTGGQLEERATELDKSTPVLLYCASGRRSAAARKYLMDQGFHDAVDLAGGIASWTAAGKPIER